MHLRQQGEAVAQAGQVAWPGAPERNAPGDALDVGALSENFVNACKGSASTRPEQGGDGILPRAQGRIIAQRMMQPVVKQAAAHAAGTGVEQGEQGWGGFAA
jgi:hypothetical protein